MFCITEYAVRNLVPTFTSMEAQPVKLNFQDNEATEWAKFKMEEKNNLTEFVAFLSS